jgi:hypothetical protein
VDFLDKLTTQLTTSDGRLLGPLEAPSPDARHILILDKDTRTVDAQGEVVRLIEIRPAKEVPTLPQNKKLVGIVYNFEPSGSIFDKPVYLTLGYDVNQLPQNVTSVKLAYYNSQSGWVILEPESGRVAEVGKASAAVNHFTLFAVLADVSPASPTTAHFEWTKALWWILLILIFLILLMLWLLRRYVLGFKSRDRDS